MPSEHNHSTYSGPERRRHRAFVTRNTEYHFDGEVCVAVRDRKSGSWLVSHLAVNRTLSGSVRITTHGIAVPAGPQPSVGEALFFGRNGRELITSALCSIERPEKNVVSSYPNARRASCSTG
jgi:hypothetical protein